MNTAPQRINLKPAEPALDGRQLDDLIQLWLDELNRNLPALTVDGYAFRVAYFRSWWKEEGPSRKWLLRRRDLADYGRYLSQLKTERAQAGLGYHSQNDAIRRLRQMFRWAYQAGYVEQDYGPWLPKASRRAATTHSRQPGRIAAPARCHYPQPQARSQSGTIGVADQHRDPTCRGRRPDDRRLADRRRRIWDRPRNGQADQGQQVWPPRGCF